jgi:hypothetical protein
MNTTNNTAAAADLFGEVIHTYSRRQALEDGVQVDMMQDELGRVSREHFRHPCYMTQGLWDIVEQAAANPHYCQDVVGIWHDICWMGKLAMRTRVVDGDRLEYRLIIKGAGRKSLRTVVVQIGPTDIDDPRPCFTFMLSGED